MRFYLAAFSLFDCYTAKYTSEGAQMAAYRKQREHASGGDHITTPDELEKNGQPQNDKKEI